ncbi:hypothetical protein [Nocardia sp. NPDC058480]|uniref:hypothetical protein n=1 Tax=Nocardia sp. NPDC058480 TaxID=3346522 RepID=UPI0036601C76
MDVPAESGTTTQYTVDVRQLGDGKDGEVRARMYRNGLQHAVARMPARFCVENGTIEVAMGGFGLKRCHFVDTDGNETMLVPDPASAEGRRARLEENRPQLSRILGVLATLAVLVGMMVALLQLVEPITSIPQVRELVGGVQSPLRLPLAANIAVGVAAFLGSIERALRIRTSWLDNFAN